MKQILRRIAFISSHIICLLMLLGFMGQPASAREYAIRYSTEGRKAWELREASRKKEPLEVHYIDIGEGDATLIKCGKQAMLIDAGDTTKGTTVRLYLKKQGVSELRYLLLTHPDADHIGGAASVVSNVPIDEVFMCGYEKTNKVYKNLINELDYKSQGYTIPKVGDEYKLGDAVIRIIAPGRVYDNPNDSSIGVIIKHGENRFLFTGDAEQNAESDMVRNNDSLGCDVYQVGHHGSHNASSSRLLSAAKPKYAVISCAAGNEYGHPHEEALNRLKESNVSLFRTDVQGTIVATSDGKTIKFNQEPTDNWTPGKKAETDTSKSEAAPQESISKQQTAPTLAAPEPVVEPDPVVAPAAGTAYVANTNTHKFHYPSCSSVSDMKAKNRWDVTITRDELIAMGYQPCKRCNP